MDITNKDIQNAINIAKKLTEKHYEKVELEDLKEAAVEGLVRAWENYNPTKGTKFEAFMYVKVKSNVLDLFKRLKEEMQLKKDYLNYLSRINTCDLKEGE